MTTNLSGSVADQCRQLGLKVGDTIEGTEKYKNGWNTTRLTLLWLGEKEAAWSRTYKNHLQPEWSEPEEDCSWNLGCRDWRKVYIQNGDEMTEKNTQAGAGLASDLNRELGAWRTMHDAPKNGTEILGWRADCGILLIKYMSASELFSEEELKDVDDDDTLFKDDWWATCWNGVWRLEGDEIPEFWMPLPAEPRSA